MAGLAYALVNRLNMSDVTVKTTAGNVTMVNEGVVVVKKASGAATQVTLPPNAGNGGLYPEVWVVDGKGDAATNNITVVPSGSDTINGGSSHVISENYGAAKYFFNGTEWNVSGQALAVSAAELAFVNGVTAGTGLASKALVLDASSNVTWPDDGAVSFGGVAVLGWVTDDANANKLVLQMPTGGGTDVPVMVVGQGAGVLGDMGIHDGITEPTQCWIGVGAVATGPRFEFRKARGTAAAPTVVTSADDLGQIDSYACVAAAEWVRSTQILFECTGTVATTRGPGVITFKTATDAAPSVLTSALVIGANQVVVPQSGLTPKSLSAAAIATTRALTVQDSGCGFSVAKTSAYAITLPTPAQGIRFKFLVLDTGANAVTISDGSAHLFGVVSVNNVNIAMTGTTLSLVSAGSVGDWVEFEGIDATHWHVTGSCIAAGKITIA